mmetsp:Transcript_13856/g.59299  ORF Transcript_13856/g.59299 Transcript_13856/m.59299 type:complete len:225 (+) Transcript_13856:4151-4825(+)
MVSNYLHAIDHCTPCTTKDKHPTCIQGFCRTHSALPRYDTFREHQRSCQCSPPSLRKIPVGAPLAKIMEQRASIWLPSTSHHSRLDILHDYCHRLAHRQLSYSRTVKHPPSRALLPSRCSHKLNRRTGFCLWACQCLETLSRLLPQHPTGTSAPWPLDYSACQHRGRSSHSVHDIPRQVCSAVLESARREIQESDSSSLCVVLYFVSLRSYLLERKSQLRCEYR